LLARCFRSSFHSARKIIDLRAPALAVPDEPPSYYTDNEYSPKSENYKPFVTHVPLPLTKIPLLISSVVVALAGRERHLAPRSACAFENISAVRHTRLPQRSA